MLLKLPNCMFLGLLGLEVGNWFSLTEKFEWLSQWLSMYTYIYIYLLLFSCSIMSDSLWPLDCSLPGFSVHHQFPEVTQTHVHRISDAIQPSHPLSSPSPLTFNVSQHQVFSNESVLHIRWPKYWSFSFSISPPNAYSGLISFRMDWFYLAVQGPLKSLLQHHNSKASILRHPAFFIVLLSHPFMTTGKTIALTRWTFVGKVMSLLFSMLFWLVIPFHGILQDRILEWVAVPFSRGSS